MSIQESNRNRGEATGSGFVRLNSHSLVRMTGRDRNRLLHSFCTAEIKQLAVGQATEAFLLDEKGKIIWFCLVLALADELILIGAGDCGAQIQKHLDRFVIREDVKVENISSKAAAFFVCESSSNQTLQNFDWSALGLDGLPTRNEVLQNAFSMAGVAEKGACLAHVEIAGWGYLLIADSSNSETIEDKFKKAGLRLMLESEFQLIRIQAGTPWYGIDIDHSNLPQEVNRDELAISFRKGCYLGQETVARIDALGHVNQSLVGLDIEASEEPKPGTEFLDNGKVVGRITSIAGKGGRYLGLGFVRRAFAEKGTELCLDEGRATVV